MRPKFTASRMAVDLIMAFEGFRAEALRLDDGRWTIGFGHTKTAREGAHITAADGEALLAYDLMNVARSINEHVFAPINQNQFDALCSFAFNIGDAAFLTSPTLRRLNEGRPLDAAAAMELFRKADLDGDRIVVDALVRRRAAEKALFLKPIDGWMEASTPVLPPQIDYDLMGLIPLTSPVAARSVTDGERLFAEREPGAEPELEEPLPAEDAPLASEAAAAAVIERLEALFTEPEHAPAGEIDAAPPEAAAETVAPFPRQTEPTHEPPAPDPVSIAPVEHLEPFPAEPEPGPLPEVAELMAAPAEGPRRLEVGDLAAPQPAEPAVHPDRAAMAHVEMQVEKPRPRWLGPTLVAVLGLVGVGFLALAAVWGLQSPSEPVLGVSPRFAGLSVGVVGVIAVGLAAYLMLERLSLPRGRSEPQA